MPEERGIWLPDGVDIATPIASPPLPDGHQRGMVVNESGLPDDAVMEAVGSYFEEHASVLGANSSTTFQRYSNRTGSLLARSEYRTPTNTIDEIILARDLVDRDDDVAATLRAMLAIAFSEGMQHSHEDEVTVAMFDEIAANCSLDTVLQDLYREYVVAQSVTTVSAFTRDDFNFTPQGADRARQRSMVAPLIGVLPAELIRIVGTDLFQTGTLAYRPATATQEDWLREFFSPDTTAARKAEMRRQDPVLATLLVEQLPVEDQDEPSYVADEGDANYSCTLYRLNPRMAHRSSAPKGAWKYPRPLLTRNFALLEAKRLLNIMDYALLQGGANFLVIAKKGTDQRPALQEEIGNLREQVRRATRTGVLIGDHRLSIEIITPDLGELLNPGKRHLLGRKIAAAMLGLPEFSEQGGEGQAVIAGVEILARVIAGDRRFVRRHVEEKIYREVVKRNTNIDSAPKIWFPKIVLQGLQFFTDLVLKLRDRGDISRRSAVEAGGFSYDAEVQQRKREKSRGDDRVMTPAAVPFDSPNKGPQDNPTNGRPPAGTGPDPARKRQVVTRNAGETVRARYDDATETSYRVGDLTELVLEEYADVLQQGRLTRRETQAISKLQSEPVEVGTTVLVPVNDDEKLDDLRALRLDAHTRVIVGYRPDDGAMLARAYSFRGKSKLEAEEQVLRWGYEREEHAA